jgi:hypothetical protein
MAETAGPLEGRLLEIEAALKHGLYYLAVTMALTMPDVCATLEDPRAYSGYNEYCAWYNKNLAQVFPFMSAEDCYSLRCGVVHQGGMGLKTKRKMYSRVIFTLPSPEGSSAHNCVFNTMLQFDAIEFCRSITASVRLWYRTNSTDPIVAKNLGGVVRFYPHGIGGLYGLPVIA